MTLVKRCVVHQISLLGDRCPFCSGIEAADRKTVEVSKLLDDTNPTAAGTEADVCRDIAERQAKGIAKYGTTVANNPLTLRQWLQHAYEECLDQAVYLKRAMAEIDRNTLPVVDFPPLSEGVES